MRRARHKNIPLKDEDGRVIKAHFQESDLEILKLLSPYARDPWGYQYLPTQYFGPLLGRHKDMHQRLRLLFDEPTSFLRKVNPPFWGIQDIYALDDAGVRKLKQYNEALPPLHHKVVHHELMSDLIGASFELASKKYNQRIVMRNLPDVKFRPDWPVFSMGAQTYYIEADRGTMPVRTERDKVRSIQGKFRDNYLPALARGELNNCLILFYMPTMARIEEAVHCLEDEIDRKKYNREFAECFGFAHMPYSPFFKNIIEPSAWAYECEYQSPFGPFKLREGGGLSETRPQTRAVS